MDRRPKIDVELMSNALWHGALDKNKPGEFVNKMQPPIEFGDDYWDVAVSAVQYEHSWRLEQVYYAYVIFFYKSKNDDGDGVYEAEIAIDPNRPEDGNRLCFNLPIGPNRQKRIVSTTMTGAETSLVKADVYESYFSFGEEQKVEYIGLEIADAASAGFRRQYGTDLPVMKYQFIERKQRSYFLCDVDNALIYLEGENRALARILGYDQKDVRRYGNALYIDIQSRSEAELPPRYPTPSSLMLYSSIVEEQRCGDANVRLLASVPVSSKFGDMVQYDFIKPNFKPVTYGLRQINEIDIQIHNHAGRQIDFRSGITRVSLVFRKSPRY